MSHEMSGSEKLKAECQTMASLTPEEISQIAGGLSGFSAVNFNTFPSWLIRGIPVDIYHVNAISAGHQ
ncbi:MAG: hypothetical protein K2Y07_03940 [Nitrosomonas sp.]|nr:hypothetical protein [Nitrosomonas sp.]OQW84738.1 MAG: hypothetical protein BVN30_02540 [Proteobacteria bacterium ST_bin16]